MRFSELWQRLWGKKDPTLSAINEVTSESSQVAQRDPFDRRRRQHFTNVSQLKFNNVIVFRDLSRLNEYSVAALDALLTEKTTRAVRYYSKVDITPQQGLLYFLEDALGKSATFGPIPYAPGEDSYELRDDVLHTVGIARLAQELLANRTHASWQQYLKSQEREMIYSFGDLPVLFLSLQDYRNPSMNAQYSVRNDLRFTLTDATRIIGKPLTSSEKKKLHQNHNLQPQHLQRIASEADLATLVGNDAIIGSARMYTSLDDWRRQEQLVNITQDDNPHVVHKCYTVLDNHPVIKPYKTIAAYNQEQAKQQLPQHRW